ncbi:PAS domain-containing sensor histidine kinase, partial [Xanthovirga aplysinae]|uniref:PAS domain-containing sensor histidine kinase n=1 Tax=Xanthovirga aplysinae TaxID=2529853 RepID=UPI0016573213
QTHNLSVEVKEKQKVLEKITDYKTRLQEAGKMAQLYAWTYFPQSNSVEISEELKEFLGFKLDQSSFRFGSKIDLVHPDSREKYFRFFKSLRKGIQPKNVVIKYRTPSGLKHLIFRAKPLFNLKKEVYKVMGVLQDISYQKEIERQLRAKNVDLQKINQELDKFVYSISHDINAPISSVLGLLNIMKYDLKIPKALLYVRKMENSVMALKNYVGAVLDFSRNTRIAIEVEEINFPEIIRDTFEKLKVIPKGEKITLRKEMDIQSSFYSDPYRLKVIFSNLITNAILYGDLGKDHPYVRISIQSYKEKCLIKFEDNGMGIPENLQRKVFDMFFRGSELSTGSGLGLYVVKEMILKLGGKIMLTSEEGVGSTFNVVLPNLTSSEN